MDLIKQNSDIDDEGIKIDADQNINFLEKSPDEKPMLNKTYTISNANTNEDKCKDSSHVKCLTNNIVDDNKDIDCELSKEDENAMIADILLDPTMQKITTPTPVIDLEEEQRQKYHQMLKNTIIMRGRVLAMEIKLAGDNVDNDVNTPLLCHFKDKIREIWLMLESSNTYLLDDRLDDSKEYLSKAEEMFRLLCPEKQTKKADNAKQDKTNDNILKNVKPKNYQPGKRDTVTVVGNKEDVMKCLRVAEKAMSDNNFVKAKRILHKAQRIFHTPAATNLLEQIRILEDTKSTLESAEKTGKVNYDDAQTTVTAVMKENQEHNTGRVPRTIVPTSTVQKPSESDARKRRAYNLLIQAEKAYSDDDLYTACKLAKKSKLIDPAVEADNFLTKVSRDMNEPQENQEPDMGIVKETSTSGTNNDCDTVMDGKETSPKNNINDGTDITTEANCLRRKARVELDKKNYDQAEMLAKKSLKLNPVPKTKCLLNNIRKEKSKAHMKITQKAQKPCIIESVQETTKNGVRNYSKTSKNNEDSKNSEKSCTRYLIHSSDSEIDIDQKEVTDDEEKSSNDICRNKTKPCDENEKQYQTKSYQKPGIGSSWTDTAVFYFEKAKSFFLEGNTEEAELNALKSKNMQKNEGVEELLQKIRGARDEQTTLKTEQFLSQVKTQFFAGDDTTNIALKDTFKDFFEAHVNKLIDFAKDAISREDFKLAENILKKSRKIFKTEAVDVLMKKVERVIRQRNLSDHEESVNEMKGDELIAVAISAINDKEYDFAEMLLKIAIVKYKVEFAKELLPIVQKEGKIDCHKKRTVEVLRVLAAKYVKIAQNMRSERLLENAEDLLIIAQNTYPSDEAKELLTDVRNILYSRDLNQVAKSADHEWTSHKKAKQGDVCSESYKSNCYVQIAQRAFHLGEYVIAKTFLREAYEYKPSRETKHLLRQVKKADFMSKCAIKDVT